VLRDGDAQSDVVQRPGWQNNSHTRTIRAVAAPANNGEVVRRGPGARSGSVSCTGWTRRDGTTGERWEGSGTAGSAWEAGESLRRRESVDVGGLAWPGDLPREEWRVEACRVCVSTPYHLGITVKVGLRWTSRLQLLPPRQRISVVGGYGA
jgi:hypothetical protein